MYNDYFSIFEIRAKSKLQKPYFFKIEFVVRKGYAFFALIYLEASEPK